MRKKIIYLSLFALIFILAVQSVSASDIDFNNAYSNDLNLDDSIDGSLLSSLDTSTYDSESSIYDSDESSHYSLSLASDENIGAIDEDVDLRDDDSSQTDSEEGEDDNRNSTSISADPIVIDYGTEGELKINLSDENGLGLFNKTIFVQINDSVSNVTTDENGLAIFKYSNGAGTYDVSVSFNGDEVYAPSNIATKITIERLSTNLKVPDVKSYLTCSTYVLATLTDSEGRAIADKDIFLVISGTTYNATTDGEGIAKIKVPTKVGNFTASLRFLKVQQVLKCL